MHKRLYIFITLTNSVSQDRNRTSSLVGFNNCIVKLDLFTFYFFICIILIYFHSKDLIENFILCPLIYYCVGFKKYCNITYQGCPIKEDDIYACIVTI
jgi:hypothetical protein